MDSDSSCCAFAHADFAEKAADTVCPLCVVRGFLVPAIDGELELSMADACEDFFLACFGCGLLFDLLGVGVHI